MELLQDKDLILWIPSDRSLKVRCKTFKSCFVGCNFFWDNLLQYFLHVHFTNLQWWVIHWLSGLHINVKLWYKCNGTYLSCGWNTHGKHFVTIIPVWPCVKMSLTLQSTPHCRINIAARGSETIENIWWSLCAIVQCHNFPVSCAYCVNDLFHLHICVQAFVIFVNMCREALDDFRRFCRDREVNSQVYQKVTSEGLVNIPSSDIQVSDLIVVEKVGHG